MREPVKDWREIGVVPEPKATIESGDLEAALNGFATREMLDYRLHGRFQSDNWVCGFGVVLWLMCDTDGAARVWSRACDEAFRGKFKYSSTGTFQSGLLLWFASVWLKDEACHEEAAALFEKLLNKRKPVMGATFSTFLARFLRGELDLSEVRDSENGYATHERLTLFYAGVRAYEHGDAKETRRFWGQVKPPDQPQVELEYYILKHQIKKLPE
jgi:hypothetical protein